MHHAERPGGPVAAAQNASPMVPCLFWRGAFVAWEEMRFAPTFYPISTTYAMSATATAYAGVVVDASSERR